MLLYLSLVPGTNLERAVSEGIKFMEENMAKHLTNIIILLTDGQPTAGITNSHEILSNTRKNNTDLPVIYTLGFGEDVDFDFLKKLALQSGGFARKIYTTSDAALQLKNFYQEVSIPLLAHVKITYETTGTEISDMTNHEYKTYSKGKEMLVAGKLQETFQTDSISVEIKPRIKCSSSTGNIELTPSTCNIHNRKTTQMSLAYILERMWAYLTIKELMDKISKNTGEEDVSTLEAKTLEMSLKVNTQGTSNENKQLEYVTCPFELIKCQLIKVALREKFIIVIFHSFSL